HDFGRHPRGRGGNTMSMPPATEETWITCLTPEGTGAIATLALRGPRAWNVLADQFSPRGDSSLPFPQEPELERIWLGQLGPEIKDEVVLTVRARQPQPWVEVHCHGGREVIGLLLEHFERRGLRKCSWQEFLSLAESDPLGSLALVALCQAPTVR